MKTLYSTNEVAKIFHINRSTVKRWTDERKLECTKTPGGHRRFTRDAIIAFSERFQFSGTLDQETLMQSDDTFVMHRLVKDHEGSSMRSVLMSAALQGKRFDVQSILMDIMPATLTFDAVLIQLISPLLLKLDRLHLHGKIDRESLLLAKTTLVQALLWNGKPPRSGVRSGMHIILMTIYEEMTPELWLLDTWYSSQGYTVINTGIPTSAGHLSIWSPSAPEGSMVLCLVRPEQNDPDAHRMLLDLALLETDPMFQCFFGTLPSLLHAVSTAVQFTSLPLTTGDIA